MLLVLGGGSCSHPQHRCLLQATSAKPAATPVPTKPAVTPAAAATTPAAKPATTFTSSAGKPAASAAKPASPGTVPLLALWQAPLF